MKNLIVLFILANISWALAQTKATDTYIVRRIDLSEKFNKPLKTLPPLLIRSFCEKKVNAFYPMAMDTAVTFNSFLNHFGVSVPDEKAEKAVRQSFPDCQGGYCNFIDPYMVGCFSFYIDVYEQLYHDRTTKHSEYKPVALQIVFSSKCDLRGIETAGPIFKLDDVYRIGNDVVIANPQNDAAPFTLERIFIQRLYHASIYKHNDEIYDNPSLEEKNKQKKQVDEINERNEN